MSKKFVLSIGIWIFAFGIIDVLNIVSYPEPFHVLGWILTIIGILLLLGGNFMKNKNRE